MKVIIYSHFLELLDRFGDPKPFLDPLNGFSLENRGYFCVVAEPLMAMPGDIRLYFLPSWIFSPAPPSLASMPDLSLEMSGRPESSWLDFWLLLETPILFERSSSPIDSRWSLECCLSSGALGDSVPKFSPDNCTLSSNKTSTLCLCLL